jgi:UDP-glucose 4-epimerase
MCDFMNNKLSAQSNQSTINLPKVLVIGASGFIGLNLLLTLSKAGFYVHGFSRTNLIHTNLSKEQQKYIFWSIGDLCNIQQITDIIESQDFDAVIHAAGTLIPSSNKVAFEKEATEIILPTFKILDILAKRKVRMIYISSGGTFYKESGRKSKEEDTLEISTYYALSKKICEDHVLFSLNKDQTSHVVLRLSNVFGRFQRSDGQQGLLGTLIRNIQTNTVTNIWGDGSAVRDYISVDLVCKYIKTLIQAPKVSGVFNLGSGLGLSVNNILKIFDEISPVTPQVKYAKARNFDKTCVILDVTKIQSVIGIEISDTVKELKDFIFSELYR